MSPRAGLLVLFASIALVRPRPITADETSTGDKLRILYSSRVTFTDDGDPLVTIEVMGGQRRALLSAPGGLIAMPDGDGGAEVRAGSRWTVTLEGGAPAELRDWTVVERLAPERDAELEAALSRWKKRGHQARAFEVGSLFAVDGEVMDGRSVLVAIDPASPSTSAARARAIASKYDVPTEVHRELVRRPRGVVVARSGDTEVRNPGVVWFAPAVAGQAIEVADVVTGGGGSQSATGVQDRRYLGRVYVAVGADGALAVVNAIPAEKLLAGLVPAEIFPTAPGEALRAQAIAARTELLQKIGTRHLEDPFHICSSQHCQVYSGAGHEDPRTTAAVAATRGKVLLRPGKRLELIDARYSADCGGHGEDKSHIWGGAADPILRGRLDALPGRSPWSDGIQASELDAFLATARDGSYCAATRHSRGRHRWETRIEAGELDRLVAQVLPAVGRVKSIEALDRSRSGRIGKLRVVGASGSGVVAGDLAIRRLFGGLKSSLFKVTPEGPVNGRTAFLFRGAGFGHGVGMCQLGAIGMAEQRQKFAEILEHYYPGSRLHRLY
jgi:stage II sporulation protein D